MVTLQAWEPTGRAFVQSCIESEISASQPCVEKELGQLLKNALCVINALAVVATAIVACLAYSLAYEPLRQADLHKRWQNYNDINSRYAELYKDLPLELDSPETTESTESTEPSPAVRRWARRYFDLTSEEYWLHLQGLLPSQTWECRIAPGVARNLRQHKNLRLAYEAWKKDVANVHPADFVAVIDSIQKQLPPCRNGVPPTN